MRIAFYAPMKPPDHPVPSGDRQIARLFMAALTTAGHDVKLASDFRSFDGAGDAAAQAAAMEAGFSAGVSLMRAYGAPDDDWRPDLWFTYHLFHKAPDWIGPTVSQGLEIPYVVAEASFAPKQAGGPWKLGHDAVAETLSHADAVLFLNPADRECVAPLLRPDAVSDLITPFTDVAPFQTPRTPADAPRLLAIGMMRPGDKLASYRCLADALGRLGDAPWSLTVVGAGDARAEVEAAFGPFAGRCSFVGAVDAAVLPALYAEADILVWPGIREAIGMTLLEAQAAGLPVVTGNAGAAEEIVAHGVTGLVTPEGDAAAFADAVNWLLKDAETRKSMGEAAAKKARNFHSLEAAGATLADVLDRVMAGR